MMIITQKITSLAYEIHDGKCFEVDCCHPETPGLRQLEPSALVGKGGAAFPFSV